MKRNQEHKELLTENRELRRRIQQVEEFLDNKIKISEKLKTRFLSNISHQVRTPMNAIIGFTNLLNDPNLPYEKREEYLDLITDSTEKLLQMFEGMVDMSLLETGQMKINQEACYVSRIMVDTYHFFNNEKHRHNKQNIALLLNNHFEDDNLAIITDTYRLKQILHQLLNNAFKFTEKGVIEFGYALESDNFLHFFVKDSGRGVLLEKSRTIFECFEKIENSNDVKELGIGLGLPLCKGILELLGGKIWVESNIFRGSTFEFTVPYNPAREMKDSPDVFSSKLYIA